MRVYDVQGRAQALITDFLSLDYELRLNDFDLCTLVIHAAHPARAYFTKDAIIEVWRQPGDAVWLRDGVFLHRSKHLEYTDSNLHHFTSYGRGLLDLLHRREIRYKGTANTKQIGPGESCILAYVNQNAGPDANNALRLSNGVVSGLQVGPDGARGSLYQGDNGFRNLLDVIQSIGASTGVDFDLLRLGVDSTRFMFLTGVPTVGRDRVTSQVFSTLQGNLLAPSYTSADADEINSVAVLGSGTDVSRLVLIVDDPYRIAESPWNTCEGSTNAGNTALSADLTTAGQTKLTAGRPIESFDAMVIQTPQSLYGVHYNKGDLVTVQIDDIKRAKKITNVHITMSEHRENIQIAFSDYGRI